jgi:polyribonucleotide nucleotidyltransferase
MHSVSRIGSSRWTHSLFSNKALRHPQRGFCDISKISLCSFSSSNSSALRSTRCRIQTTWRHPRAVSSTVQLSTITQPGPNLEFHVGKIANLTESSVIGTSGQTVALVTMATSSPEIDTNNLDSKGLFKHFLKLKCQRESSSAMVPLTVEYRQRHHAVGKIPTSASRSDNRRLTNAEILASRAIDRALRPLLQSPLESDNDAVHLTCSIQACPIAEDGSAGGHPVSLALNAASVALNNRLKEPVAAVYLCLLQDGTVIEDSSRSFGRDGKNDSNTVVGELLYAGTRENVVMMEFAGKLSESHLTDLITKAHDSIQTRLRIQQSTLSGLASSPLNDDSDDMLKQALGLSSSPANMKRDDSIAKESEEIKTTIDDIFNDAYQYCEKHAGEAALRLFGVASSIERSEATTVSIYSEEQNGPLLGKALRGRREHLVHEEIHRLLREFIPSNKEIATVFQSLTKDDSSILTILADAIGSRILKKAMQEAAIKYGCRADGRANKKIRPVTAEVPALPDIVHGSALFTRGETQVLCTTTLGPPKDGILINDPYEAASLAGGQDSGDEPYNDLPVGSLRYLRNQEYLESDMNSRKVKASHEQTGDSGTLRERRRAFLQYDFPSYSKGEIQTGPGTSASRREIGHGRSHCSH